MKLLALAIATVVSVYFLIQVSDLPNRQVVLVHKSEPKVFSVYNPADVETISWRWNDKSIQLRRSRKGGWAAIGSSPFDPDDWSIERRIIVLSKMTLWENIFVNSPKGEITFYTKADPITGVYDDQSFRWTTGPYRGQGFSFKDRVELKKIFDEGIFGFRGHGINLCDPKPSTAFTFLDWSLENKSGKWIAKKVKDNTEGPARLGATQSYISKICQFNADQFVAQDPPKNESTRIAVEVVEKKKKTTIQKSGDVYFAENFPAFRSKDLDQLLSVGFDDIADPSLEAGRVALDPKKSEKDRLEAIRKIKNEKSLEGIPTLKAIIFENTDVDVYRYEAVDALVAIGTKECYKFITDRLSDVGRSGFELRLARALAAAVGRPFLSDEKTSESERRPEVEDLIKYTREHPPGS